MAQCGALSLASPSTHVPGLVRHPGPASAASSSTMAGVKTGTAAAPALADETMELLSNLKRLREDCQRVAEYSGSLDATLEKRRREQDFKVLAARQARRVEKFELRQERRAFFDAQILAAAVFNLWGLLARGSHEVRAHQGEELHRFIGLKILLRWRWQAILARAEREVNGVEQGLEDARTRYHEEAAAQQMRIFDLRSNFKFLHLKELVQGMMVDTFRSCFTAWVGVVQDERRHSRRRSALIKLAVAEIQESMDFFCCEILHGWNTLARAHQDERAHAKALHCKRVHQVEARIQRQCEITLRTAFRAWVIEAEAAREEREGELQAERVEEQARCEFERLLERKKESLTRILHVVFGGPSLASFLHAWKAQCDESAELRALRRHEEHCRTMLAASTEREEQQERIHEKMLGRICDQLQSLLVQHCFSVWYVALSEGHREQRVQEQRRLQALRTELDEQSYEAELGEAWAPLERLARVLRFRRDASLRSAWQDWWASTKLSRTEQTKHVWHPSIYDDAVLELERARATARAAALERKQLEHNLSSGLTCVLRQRSLVHDAAHAVAELLCRTAMQTAFLLWRWVLMIRRREGRHESECFQLLADERELEDARFATKTAHAKKVLNIMVGRGALVLLSPCIHAWRSVKEAEAHSRMLQRRADDLQKQQAEQRRLAHEKWNLQATGHFERVSAATVMKAFVDHDTLLRLAVAKWRGAVEEHKAKASSIMRLVCHVEFVRVFDKVPVLVTASIKCWRAATVLKLQRMEKQSLAGKLEFEASRRRNVQLLVTSLSTTVESTYKQRLVAFVVTAWQRHACEWRIHHVAFAAQDKWQQKEFAAHAEMQFINNQATQLRWVVERRMAEQRRRLQKRLAFTAWRYLMSCVRWEEDLGCLENSSEELLQAQRCLEEADCLRQVERALAIRRRARNVQIVSRFLSAWLQAAHACKADRFRQRRVERSRQIQEQLTAERKEAILRACFMDWHHRAYKARRRWLERRNAKLLEIVNGRRGFYGTSASVYGADSGTMSPLLSTRTSAEVPWLAKPSSEAQQGSPSFQREGSLSSVSSPKRRALYFQHRHPSSESSFVTEGGQSQAMRRVLPNVRRESEDDFAARLWKYTSGAGLS